MRVDDGILCIRLIRLIPKAGLLIDETPDPTSCCWAVLVAFFVPFSLSSSFLCLFFDLLCLSPAFVSSFYLYSLCLFYVLFPYRHVSYCVFWQCIFFPSFVFSSTDLSFLLSRLLSFSSFSLCHTVSFFLSSFFYLCLRFLILTIINTYIHYPQKNSGKGGPLRGSGL